MGEGIGRSLAAGAMIQASLEELGERPIDQLTAIHAQLWNRFYRRRWRFNTILRTLLAHTLSFQALEIVLRIKPFLSQFGRIFHTGFDAAIAHDRP
jgi:hypothetical protein